MESASDTQVHELSKDVIHRSANNWSYLRVRWVLCKSCVQVCVEDVRVRGDGSGRGGQACAWVSEEARGEAWITHERAGTATSAVPLALTDSARASQPTADPLPATSSLAHWCSYRCCGRCCAYVLRPAPSSPEIPPHPSYVMSFRAFI